MGKGNPIEAGYVTVSERIEKFYELYPEGRIITHIIEHDAERGFILMRAEIFRNLDDALPAASGHAYELKSEGFVNRTSYIENAETSVVGRALAMLGFEIKRGIASEEEMKKVERMQTPITDNQKQAIQVLRLALNEKGFFATGQDAKDHLSRFTGKRTDNASTLTSTEASDYIRSLKEALVKVTDKKD